MKKLALLLLLFALPEAYALPRQAREQRLQPRPADRPRANANRRAVVEEAVYAFYVDQFQQQAEMSPDVFVKVLPLVRQFVRDRFQIGDRRARVLDQLRQAVLTGSSEDDLKRIVRELDLADADFQSNQEKFFSSVDPLLNARQQAKVRLIQIMADNRIRQALQAVQNPPRQD
jgi:hypothetical protein